MNAHAPSIAIVAPGLIEQRWNEAEVLGSAVWLWMHSASHRDFPLHTLPTLLLPAIKHRQFILASQADKPVFYLSWANFDLQAERRYLSNNPLSMPEADWNCGDRQWLLDWVAPFGHTQAMSRMLKRRLFANRCLRTLYHRGNERGFRIKHFRGSAVLPAQAREWFESHPVAYPDQSSPD
ncbi:putative hemolysin activating-like protein [Sterolibacterium denitrificans]|uniref:RTX toxin-activating lysine-acyltransferase n=1 Tax=Sterolibacterium denitrificans TaxID=157592 RepID=A0A7Z7HP71_9PROT|nr:toxin-activating lysine-acyltransferase [Sterolibacterium denitrificans]SMB21502.1 putative hemolysin activating-like protein [Sterolibacterium denitrificans]